MKKKPAKKPAKTPRQREIEALEREMKRAKQKRAANRKLREAYRDDPRLQSKTRKALIADLLRVYSDVANPYRNWAASRKRYRQLGHFPEIMVEDFFGNHQEFQRAAGLLDKRETTKVRNKAARVHTHQQIAAYAEKHVLPWHDKYKKTRGKKHLEVVIGSDFHSCFLDPFAFQVFCDTLRMVQPDMVVLNGDVFDFPQLSRHRKLPGHFHLNVQQEINLGFGTILKKVRELCPDAEILFMIGNHEYRFVTYLADCAPELACLDTIEFDKLFKLDELEISLGCRASFMAPSAKNRRRELAENWHIIGGCFVVTHGTYTNKLAAEKQIQRFQMAGSSGHTHRPMIITTNSLATGSLPWMSTPMMASFAVGKEFVPEPSMWTMGFGVVSIDTQRRRVCPQLVTVHSDWAAFAGHTWTPTAKTLEARARMLEV